ncbi:hypothetical protein YC2023_043629 [Brassica napus]
MGLCFWRRRSRVCGSSAVRVRVGDASYLGFSSEWANSMKLLFADERASSPDVKSPRRQGLNEYGSGVSWSLRYWGCTLQLEEGDQFLPSPDLEGASCPSISGYPVSPYAYLVCSLSPCSSSVVSILVVLFALRQNGFSPRFGYAISFILVLNFIAVVVETTLDIEESSAQKPWMDICVGDGSEDRFIWIRELLEGWSKAETEHQNDLKTKAEEMADYRKNGSNQHAQHPNQREISRQASGFMRDARRADYGTRSHSYRDNENKTRYVANEHTTQAHLTLLRQNALSKSQKRLDCSRNANSEHLSSAQRQERPVSPQRSTQSDYQNASRVLVPEEAIREAREELREVMIQYVNGADPSESAARRERMRYAEENGETEQVIMNMAIEATVSAEGARRTAETQTIVERIPALSRLGSLHDQDTVDATEPEDDRRMSDVQTSAERISVLSRLGATQETIITPEADTLRITVKKRLGRPPPE